MFINLLISYPSHCRREPRCRTHAYYRDGHHHYHLTSFSIAQVYIGGGSDCDMDRKKLRERQNERGRPPKRD
jgi:hypothetical protein